MTLISVLILSLFLTIVLTPIFMHLAAKTNTYLLPNARKTHHWPIPRVGGIAMAIGAFIPILIYASSETLIRAYLAGALIIVIFGIIDDTKGLGVRVKFTGQIIAALIAVLYGGVKIITLGALLPDDVVLVDWFSVILTVFIIVGVTNAINLADGMDGLAGGISLLSFLFIAYLANIAGNNNIAIVAIALSGAIFGFLRFNTYPASLFMGDTGSQLLGFSAAFLCLILTQGITAMSPLLPLIILGFPIMDTITVMYERIAEGRSPFSADMNHFHHRLVRMGLFPTEAVFVIYVIQAFLIVSAYALRFRSEWLIMASYLVFSSLILVFFHMADAVRWRIQRFPFIDRLKMRLKILRGKGFFILLVFKPVEIITPLLLILICFLPTEIQIYFSAASAAAAFLIGILWSFKRDWAKRILTLSLYFFIPFLIYTSENHMVPWMEGMMMQIYNLSFLALAALSLITLRLTKRKRGFKLNPTDFLVLFVTLTLFILPDLRIHFGSMAIKSILLLFTYEIVRGEIREKYGILTFLTVTAFVIVAVRGF